MTKEENKKILLSHKKEFIYKFIISIILNVLLLIIPIYYSKIIDNITILNLRETYLNLLVFAILTILYRISEIYNQRAYYHLHSRLYHSYTNLGLCKTYYNSLYSLSRFSLSEFSNIMSEDFEFLSEYYSTLVIRIVEIFEFIYIIIYFFFINKIIGLLTIIVSIIVIIYLIIMNKKISQINLERKDKNDKRISFFQEIFLSLRAIKGFNILKIINKRSNETISNYIESNNKLNIKRYDVREISLGIVDIFKIIVLFFSIHLIFNGYMTIGIITLIYNYYSKLSELFTSIIVLSESANNKSVASKRIFKLFQYAKNREVEEKDNNDIKGDILFNNVLYGNKLTPILKNVSLSFPKNSFTILTGNMKNSEGIFDLLLRYNDIHSGSIMIDKVNINEYSMNNISHNIGFVMENPILFNQTILDNLMLFDNDFQNIIHVCQKLDIYDYIMSLEKGFGTLLQDNASNINSDVKYLLAFANLLLKNPKIILIYNIWDKISNPTLKIILDNLEELKKEHTIIIITKDNKIIKNNNVDKIIMFAFSEVLFCGKHHELYENSSKYRELLKKM